MIEAARVNRACYGCGHRGQPLVRVFAQFGRVVGVVCGECGLYAPIPAAKAARKRWLEEDALARHVREEGTTP